MSDMMHFMETHYAEGLEVLALLGGADPNKARFVGGMVRDMLLGKVANDIDIATAHSPETVMALLKKAGLKVIPTGMAHGTVTAVLHDVPMQITSLREDIVCDGRHAHVAFSEDWKADAERRDFTFNALSISGEGQLYDYTEGVADLQLGRVRFIGDPEQRIAEDHLRILRYVRFIARFYQPGTVLDVPSLEACLRHTALLQRLSAERVHQELWQFFTEPAAALVLALAEVWGVIQAVLPELVHQDSVLWLYRLQEAPLPALVYIAAGVRDTEEGLEIAKRLRCSNKEKQLLRLLLASKEIEQVTEPVLQAWLIEQGRDVTRWCYFLHLAMQKALPDAAMLVFIADAPIPVFPLAGKDLLHHGVVANAQMGVRLEKAKHAWVKSGYTLTKAELVRIALHREVTDE